MDSTNKESFEFDEHETETSEDADGTASTNGPEFSDTPNEARKRIEQEYPDKLLEEILAGFREGIHKLASDIRAAAEQAGGPKELINEQVLRFVDDMVANADEHLNAAFDLYQHGKKSDAYARIQQYIESLQTKAEEYFGEQGVEWFKEYADAVKEVAKSKDSKKKSMLKRSLIVLGGSIPIVGPGMDIYSAIRGMDVLAGSKLSKSKRLWKATSGTAWLTLDIFMLSTGSIVGKKLAKGAAKAGMRIVSGPKFLTRSAVLMRKMGVAKKVYMPIFRFGSLLMKSKLLTRTSTRAFEYMLAKRLLSKKMP